MKKTLVLLLVSSLLVFSLAACGSDKEQNANGNDMTNQGTSDTNPSDGNNNSSNDSMLNPDHQDDSLMDDTKDVLDDIGDDVEKAGDALTGDNATKQSQTGGVTYEQMLRNARVHDQDGFLNDHENSTSSDW